MGGVDGSTRREAQRVQLRSCRCFFVILFFNPVPSGQQSRFGGNALGITMCPKGDQPRRDCLIGQGIAPHRDASVRARRRVYFRPVRFSPLNYLCAFCFFWAGCRLMAGLRGYPTDAGGKEADKEGRLRPYQGRSHVGCRHEGLAQGESSTNPPLSPCPYGVRYTQ